jgi:exosortase
MIATDLSEPIEKPSGKAIETLWPGSPSRATWGALALVILVFGCAYAQNFRALFEAWTAAEGNYSHGLLVIPIAIWILWQRLADAKPEALSSTVPAPWWGWVCLAAVLAARAFAYDRGLQQTENATILPALACLTWTFGGWPLLRQIWVAIAYLVFMIPLPQSVNNLITLPLQSIATTGSCFLLQLSGLWAIQQGNVINVDTPHGMTQLDVALACSGLKMLMTMTATVVAILILVPLATWKRIVLLVSVVPIALVSNIIRITTTGWCYYLLTGSNTKGWAHDVTGWFMMPLALVLVGLELAVLAWLVPKEDEPAQKESILPMLTQR